MPRRALRCVVDLTVHAVSAPGVWLPSKEDVYISISMLGQYRNTRNLASVFPLIIHEKFQFEKTYYTALDPSQVADLLEDELVIFELIQLSEYTEGAVRLASFSTNARDFLYPYPTLAPIYSSTDREILMSRTVAFPGISPKLEFATKTVIKESLSPEYDALEDALEQERERRAYTYSKTRRSPVRRPRSASFSRKPAEIIPDDTIDPRPPFVVRKLDQSLIGRLPGGGPDKHAKSKQKKPTRIPLASSDDELYLDLPPKSQYHLEKVIREPLRDPLPVFKPRFATTDDEDAEVAELTSRTASYHRSRPRSASPLLYRPSFEDRYGSYSPNYYSSIAERSLDRAYLPRYLRYDDDLLDLEIATKMAKSRSPTSLVHLDRGLYWTEQAAALSGKTHREIFDRNLSKIYNRLYRNARSLEAQKA